MSKTRIVFVHGLEQYGAAAWPTQHRLAGRYDCLFLKRTGFDAVADPLASDFIADMNIVIAALGEGGHVVAHAQGAIAAMMAAVERPGLIHSLTLIEPALTSLTAELPATRAFHEHLEPLFAQRETLTDQEFSAEYIRLTGATESTATPTLGGVIESPERIAARTHRQAPSWEAPLHIVPGVPTLVLTGGWEPLYEEVADYLATTGARHVVSKGGHRPQDTAEGAELIEEFILAHPVAGPANNV